MNKWQINKSLLSKFLESNAKLSNSFIFHLSDNSYSIAASEDITLILLTQLATTDVNFNQTLNIPDCNRLCKAIDAIDTESIELKIDNNNLAYKDSQVKFKYHLLEDGFLNSPPVNIDKINAFNFDAEFKVSKALIQNIIKHSAFASTTNKIYFYTEKQDGINILFAELTDRVKSNTDSITIKMAEVDFALNPMAINFNNLRLVSLIDDIVKIKINNEFGIIVMDITSTDIELKYIFSTLTQ